MTPNQFKEWRSKMGFTQEQAAAALGYCTKSYISMMETGKRPITRSTGLLAKALESLRETKEDAK